ncbi:hypothetical protein ACG2F4_06770 [Halalkalibaculum sp. DA3122]|uniref:hypothetical protein n=1 Tax=Halalkalibaculum sp. DA3122 TaxID=3373607 RepID=UPI0037546A3B
MNKFNKKGKEAEEATYELLTSSYLSHWTFINPMDVDGDKKEICDILIFFDGHLFLISVKNYAFKGDHEKFFRKVIEKSSRQLHGAERKITNRDNIKIIHEERGEVVIKKEEITDIYLITVFHNDDLEYYPIHDLKKEDKPISIFLQSYFEKVVSEFDTTSDLIDYLIKRHNLLSNNENVSLNGNELDLAAVYLTNAREFPSEYYQKVDHVLLDISDEWNKYDQNEQTRLKRLADKPSYFIDWLVEEFILKNYSNPANTKLAEVLLNLDRLMRRVITDSLFELIDKHKEKKEFIARRVFSIDDHYYALIYVSNDILQSDLAEWLCETLAVGTHIYFADKKSSNHIVLITNQKIQPVYYAYWGIGEELDESYLEEIEKRCKEYGFLQNLKGFKKHYSEYPSDI